MNTKNKIGFTEKSIRGDDEIRLTSNITSQAPSCAIIPNFSANSNLDTDTPPPQCLVWAVGLNALLDEPSLYDDPMGVTPTFHDPITLGYEINLSPPSPFLALQPADFHHFYPDFDQPTHLARPTAAGCSLPMLYHAPVLYCPQCPTSPPKIGLVY